MIVSIIIPTKNEPLINEFIEEVHRVLKNFKHEIIVVDKSNVTPCVKGAKLIIQKTDGLGKAIIEGLKHASGELIVTVDGDFSHDPKHIPELIEKTNGYDIVIASRFVCGGSTQDKTHRVLISKFFRSLASFVLKLNIKDPLSGYSVIKRSVYDKLKLNPIGYKINMEILYKGKKFGFKSIEVPIVFHKRRAGKSKARIKEGLKTLIFIFKLKFGL